MEHQTLGRTGLRIPRIVYGTSCLGNLYESLPDETKLAIWREWFSHHAPPAVIDTAGKYRAGLALEVIGGNLRKLKIPADQEIIINKLNDAKRLGLIGSDIHMCYYILLRCCRD